MFLLKAATWPIEHGVPGKIRFNAGGDGERCCAVAGAAPRRRERLHATAAAHAAAHAAAAASFGTGSHDR
jgi:hypothetical protein